MSWMEIVFWVMKNEPGMLKEVNDTLARLKAEPNLLEDARIVLAEIIGHLK